MAPPQLRHEADRPATEARAEDPLTRLFWRALKTGLLGLVLCPALAVAAVILAMIFDPKCGPGDSGGCAMGLVTVPLAVALPGFALFLAGSLARGLWQIRPPLPTIRQLRNWGRED